MREEVRTEIVEPKLSDLAPTENNPRQKHKSDLYRYLKRLKREGR